MPRLSTIVIDGKRYPWRNILQMRQEQRAAAAPREQLALFADLPPDSRPTHERTASDRYQQPGLFSVLEGRIALPHDN